MAKKVSKSLMRLMLVQACYQYFYYCQERDVNQVLDDVLNNYALRDEDDVQCFKSRVDKKFFKQVIENLNVNLTDIDAKIAENLQSDTQIEQLNKIVLQILRVALSEFIVINTPKKILVSEFTDICGSFFDGKNTGFVNGILDKIIK